MILGIGGLGWVGSNTTEALLKRGQDCVITWHENHDVPAFLQGQLNRRLFLEPADATRFEDLERIGRKYPIDGIVVAVGIFDPGAQSPIPGLRSYFDLLLSVFRAAETWKVKRVTFTSTVGVYLGLGPGPVKEDSPVPLSSPYALISYQKIVEIAATEFARGSGVSAACVRLGGMFGPGQAPASPMLVTRLIHAAVRNEPVSLDGIFGGTSGEDASEVVYIKDLARAIALVQTAERLPHEVYNVGGDRRVRNREVLEAVKKAVPGFALDLPSGHGGASPILLPSMDIERVKRDATYSPRFDLQSAVDNYIAWLRAGHAK